MFLQLRLTCMRTQPRLWRIRKGMKSDRAILRVPQLISARVTVHFRLIVIALLIECVAVVTLGCSPAVVAQDDILNHFKYGSIGAEARIGIPYPIWRVLPIVFADKLPARPGQGYE